MLHPPCTHDARVPGQGGCRTWSGGSLPNPSPVSEDILLSTQLRLREPCCGCTSTCAARGCPAPSSPSPGAEPATRCAITESGITTTSEVSPVDSQEIEFVIRFLFGKSSVLFHAERLWPPSHDRAAGSPKLTHKLVSFNAQTTPRAPLFGVLTEGACAGRPAQTGHCRGTQSVVSCWPADVPFPILKLF